MTKSLILYSFHDKKFESSLLYDNMYYCSFITEPIFYHGMKVLSPRVIF